MLKIENSLRSNSSIFLTHLFRILAFDLTQIGQNVVVSAFSYTFCFLNFKLREVIYKQQFRYPQLETAHTAQFQATATLLFSNMKEDKLVTKVAKNQDLLPV